MGYQRPGRKRFTRLASRVGAGFWLEIPLAESGELGYVPASPFFSAQKSRAIASEATQIP